MRVLSVAAALLVLALGAVSWWLPPEVASRLNTLDRRPLPPPSERARALHDDLLVADLHDDLLLWDRDPLERGSIGHSDLPRLLDGRVGLQVFAATTKVPAGQNFVRNRAVSFDMITLLTLAQRWPPATWWSLRARALHIASRLTDASDASERGQLVLVRTARDLARVIERFEAGEGVVGGLLAAEGMHPLEGELAGVDALFEAGYRMLAPTHFFDNDIGGSAHGEVKGGLTPLGAQAIERMQQLGMLIDVAHASPATVSDVLALARAPIVVSHVGVQATCPGPRNLSDDQIDAIAASGGVRLRHLAGGRCAGDSARGRARRRAARGARLRLGRRDPGRPRSPPAGASDRCPAARWLRRARGRGDHGPQRAPRPRGGAAPRLMPRGTSFARLRC
jgi:microsomal dipeptidase-like Zn-dependent dipeptidase